MRQLVIGLLLIERRGGLGVLWGRLGKREKLASVRKRGRKQVKEKKRSRPSSNRKERKRFGKKKEKIWSSSPRPWKK